jgi:hypothetical protein
MPNIDNQLTAGIPEGKRRGERELATASSSGGERGARRLGVGIRLAALILFAGRGEWPAP